MGIKVRVLTTPNRGHDWSLSEKRKGRVILEPPNLFHGYQIQIEKIVFPRDSQGSFIYLLYVYIKVNLNYH